MNREQKINKSIAIVFFAVISFFFLSIAVRTVTRQVFVKRLGMENRLIDLIFFDLDAMTNPEVEEELVDLGIDWSDLYPFPDGTPGTEKKAEKEKSRIIKAADRITGLVDGIETNVTLYATEHLPWYKPMVSGANHYEAWTLWNFIPYTEYNGVITLSDGYLSGVYPSIDVSASVNSLTELYEYCNERDIDFLYVQYPYKVCTYEDPDVAGVTDFSNQNADRFLSAIGEKGIPYLDLRKTLHEEGLGHHEAFFRTDHHWKPETGLWAAQRMLETLNESFGYSFDTDILNSDNFRYEIYKDWFLGSQGKKVTLARTTPDDFTMIYPEFETELAYSVPSIGLETAGDFSVMYATDNVVERNYDLSCYAAYDYGDQPLIMIRNQMMENNEIKLLTIHDSFSNCVAPFMALSIPKVDELDLRHFYGSLRSYIETETPDVVIVSYNPSAFANKIDPMTHNNLFDFR